MPMLYVAKGPSNVGNSAGLGRQDISPIIVLQTTRPRPVSQYSEQVPATATTHEWREQGRNSVFTGATGFAEGGTPSPNHKSTTSYSNVTCWLGLLAQVTDRQKAVFRGGGPWTMDDGIVQRRVAEQLVLEKELAALDVMDDIEAMHIVGNRANTQAFTGGQTDGLITWITASGVVVNSTVNAAATGTTSTPVALQEAFIKDGARVSGEAFPTKMADTMLVPPELIPDINGYIRNGAASPVTITIDGKDPKAVENLVAGQSVGFYNTGFSTVKIVLEPHLSPVFNPAILQPGLIMYRRDLVKQANLIPLGAEDLARAGTAEQSMVTVEFAQEHHVPQHAVYIPNVKSAVA